MSHGGLLIGKHRMTVAPTGPGRHVALMRVFRFLVPGALVLSLVAAALFAVLTQPAPAGDRAAAVAAMLSRIPRDAVAPDKIFELQYGRPETGVSALLSLSDDTTAARLFGTGRGLPRDIAEFLMVQMDGARALVGFDMTDIRESASLTLDGTLMTLYRFDPGIGDRLGPALDALGYARDDRDGLPVWARGEDFAFDMAHRNPANPFGGRLGRWGRVALDGDLVAWSPAWAPVEGFAAGRPGMAEHPQVAALIDLLDRPEAGRGTLIAARFILDPAQGFGSPAVMSVDMADGADDVALFAFVVPPDQSAGDMAARAEWHWHNTPMRSFDGSETFADRFTGDAEFHAVATDLPVVLIRVTAPRETLQQNRSFERANDLLMQGDLELLLAPPG
jgi:hypothetical protein